MTPTALNLTNLQHGEGLFLSPRVKHTETPRTLICRNLRPIEGGGLEASGLPMSVGTVGGTPLLADRRDDRLYIFRQEDDTSLIIDGVYAITTGTYTTLGTNLGECALYVKQAESVGSYIVMLYEDGSLGYVVYEGGEYRLLGGLPQMPEISVEASSYVELTQSIEPITFKSTVSDFRSGVDSSVAAQVRSAVMEGWRLLGEQAELSSYGVQPLRFRMALRLKDGEILYVSPEMSVSAPDELWQGGGRISLPLTGTSDGFTGTSTGYISVKAYRVKFTPESVDFGVWNSLISDVEIWVSKGVDVADSGRSSSVGSATVGGELCLTTFLPMLSTAELNKALSDAPLGLLAKFAVGSPMPEMLPQPSTITYDSEIDTYSPALSELESNSVECIYSHGERLYIGGGGTLITSERGNPFVRRGYTSGIAGNIVGIIAQLWGGGAYTRQILYVATNRGILALAHNYEGVHTNCRLILRQGVDSPQLICSGKDCVYMLLSNGALTRLQGTSAYRLAGGIKGCKALLFDSVHTELWLVSADTSESVVITDSDLGQVATRTLSGLFPLGGVQELICHSLTNGEVELLNFGLSTPASCRWLTSLGPVGTISASRLRPLMCDIRGTDISTTLTLGLLLSAEEGEAAPSYHTLSSYKLQGTPLSQVRIATASGSLINPSGSHRHPVCLDLEGDFQAIMNYEF